MSAQTPATVPSIFEKDGCQVRALHHNGQTWFVAKDVCDALELKNARRAVIGNEKTGNIGLDQDEYLMYRISTSGQARKVLMVNESGMYRLIFKSQKEVAKSFQKWVVSEVLPSIRKTGEYQANNGDSNINIRPIHVCLPSGAPIKGIETDGQRWFPLTVLVTSMGYDVSNAKYFNRILPSGEIMRYGRSWHVCFESVERLMTPVRLRNVYDRIGKEELDNLIKTLWPNNQITTRLLPPTLPPKKRMGGVEYRFTSEQMIGIVFELNKKNLNRSKITEMLANGRC